MTSEYVSLGHPDRMADYISEFILDRYIEKDKNVRYALEVQVKDNYVTLAGEITSTVDFTHDEYTEFVKAAIREIGYTEEYADFWGEGNCIDPRRVEVVEHISKQSPDISQGVDNQGWGDQGIFWGYAVWKEHMGYMPTATAYAKQIGNTLFYANLGGLDIKTQVTVEGGEVTKVIVAIPMKDKEDERKELITKIVRSIVGDQARLIINGTGCYVRHSSMGDCGTTGRKLAVDFYGGYARIGGGSPWTKDPTKADLTLNIYARKKALEFMKDNKMSECHCQIECCIGQKDITLEFFDGHMNHIVTKSENKSCGEIIEELGLRKPIYTRLARQGLFSLI